MDLDLSQKIGPLPLGVWIAVIAGGLGIAYFINRDQAQPDESDSASGGNAQVPRYLTRGAVGTGGKQVYVEDPQDTVPGESDQPETNAAWARIATDWLIANGYPPGVSDNAMRKYITSRDLSIQEQKLVNRVLKQFGAPPEPLAPVDVPDDPDNETPSGKWGTTVPQGIRSRHSASDVRSKLESLGYNVDFPITMRDLYAVMNDLDIPYANVINWGDVQRLLNYSESEPQPSTPKPSPQPEPPPEPETYTVRGGDTLSEIALEVYGSAYPDWRRIYNANRGKIESVARSRGYSSSQGGKWIFPGTTLTIP